jgi:hypothetical protein
MLNPLVHIRQNPEKCKQLMGLSSAQLEKLLTKASAMDEMKKKK